MSESSKSSARFIVPYLLKNFTFSSIVDFGCGDGQFIEEFKRRGITDLKGLEGEWIVDTIGELQPDWLEIADLNLPVTLNRKFDLAICLEVGEHLEEKYARVLVESLTKSSDRILFSAAIPGQGGTHHINLQYPNYWAILFSEFGFFLELDPREAFWGKKAVAPWYQQNCLIFTRKTISVSNLVFPLVMKHPEIFPELQTNLYRFKKLPSRVFNKLLAILKAK
jgi:SAM-dependent methyltransferase